MRVLFLLLVLFHGAIHILGFIKAFGLRDIKDLKLPVSKPAGLAWLSGVILFLVFGFLFAAGQEFAWIAGLVAVVISQSLVMSAWKDAKFGTIPNIIILLVVVTAFASWSFDRQSHEETLEILPASVAASPGILAVEDILDLPSPVKKWLVISGAVGKEKAATARVEQKAVMKISPGQEEWYTAEALQYTNISAPAFTWNVEVEMNQLMFFKGRDKFADGKGEMLIKLNSLFTVADETGEKINEGSLQRYLGEIVWFPSLAVSPFISWEAVDEYSARATMNYKGTSGSGIFFFNESGDFVKFTAMRYKGNEPGAKKYEWIMTVDGYKTFEGIRVPAKLEATWRLEEGDWTWLQMEIMDIRYNWKAE